MVALRGATDGLPAGSPRRPWAHSTALGATGLVGVVPWVACGALAHVGGDVACGTGAAGPRLWSQISPWSPCMDTVVMVEQ